tara:strand:- start:34604 stop:34996 length:393 start_codon:yes stop_codon:yes gene_type:complete
VHPGYGFLPENAGFVAALDKAGVTFVGPTSEVIDLMGDKIRARAFVEGRGFPVAPSAIEDDDPATFVERSRAVGYPLLIKPSAGGHRRRGRRSGTGRGSHAHLGLGHRRLPRRTRVRRIRSPAAAIPVST